MILETYIDKEIVICFKGGSTDIKGHLIEIDDECIRVKSNYVNTDLIIFKIQIKIIYLANMEGFTV